MNFSSNEIILEAQRGRQWSPLLTQQLRLRHINQIWCLNLKSDGIKTGSFYFTLHLTSMSAPFYTSERTNGPHPKWQDLTLNKFPSASAVVLRIWRQGNDPDTDVILLTWGLHLSGLFYVSNRIADVQPSLFVTNTVIFGMVGGFFAGAASLRVDSAVPCPALAVFKRAASAWPRGDLKRSYDVEKLRKLHYLEVMIKNKSLDAQQMRDRIAQMDVMSPQSSGGELTAMPPTKTAASQLLTMNCLNRMLEEKPTRVQKREMFKMNKEIEVAKFRCKLLSHERDRKMIALRHLKKSHSSLVETNSEKESSLMEDHHALNRDKEKLREYHKVVLQHRELMVHTNAQLQHRKRQLLQQLLWIYPINQASDKKYTINGMSLPNADVLSDATDDGISVALGYVTHILLMCSTFLQVPLRYPVTHCGSRSTVTDQIVANLPEFPLFTKGKDRMQFTYGVYLLNKNIAQLRWLFFMHTPDLKLTLPNVLSFLQGYKEFKQERFVLLRPSPDRRVVAAEETHAINRVHQPPPTLDSYQTCGRRADPILDCLRSEKVFDELSNTGHGAPKAGHGRAGNADAAHHPCPGLSDILAIPEAYLNRQLNGVSFSNYLSVSSCKSGHTRCRGGSDSSVALEEKSSKSAKESENTQVSCDIHLSTNNNISKEYSLRHCESVEEGTDLLNPKTTLIDFVVGAAVDSDLKDTEHKNVTTTIANEFSHTSDGRETTPKEDLDLDSREVTEPESKNLMSKEQEEFMQNWLRTGPALVCSDKSLYPEEFLGTTSSVQNADNPLTARTDALLTTKSFNLVKPRH